MNSGGFEPPTPGLKAQCSSQAELRVQKKLHLNIIDNNQYKKISFYKIYMTQNIYKLSILKLDHRPSRDKRITTHCALVSRSFGATNFYYSGIEDNILNKTINEIVNKWGGPFNINYINNALNLVITKKKENYIIIHLTMYGINLFKEINNLKKKLINKNILIIVGGSKVPKEYYKLADYNIAVGNQPHSEISSISTILYLLNPKFIENNNFKNKNIEIVPNNNYKNIKNI
jgi:tRNA (cytidine56-2'-O)-methyltransferase